MALCFMAFSTTKAQVIDTAVTSITACKINPFKAKYTDTVNVDHLGVRIINDNLNNACTLYWALLDKYGVIHLEGNATITGAAYTTWNGNNAYPFQFVANQYGLTFIQ